MTLKEDPKTRLSAPREGDKVMLVLCYLSLLSLVPLLTVKDSDYVRWHAKNGLALWGCGVALISIFSWTPGLQLLGCFFPIFMLVVSVVGIRNALRGERWRIPGVTALAEKF